MIDQNSSMIPRDAPRYGVEHNYSVWGANTVITFHRVPWSPDYRDVVNFESQTELDLYLKRNSNGISYTTVSYAKAYENVRVPLPFNAIYDINYLRVFNPAQPISGDRAKAFYYFVKDIKYIAPETTELIVQLDVYQTFGRDITFGRCFVERGHIGVANSRRMDDYGRTYLTVPEGFDLGSDYYTQSVYEHKLADNSGENKIHILVWTTTNIAAGDYGSVDNPNMTTASASHMAGLPNGTDVLWFTDVRQYFLMLATLSNYPWITQGIQMVYGVPPLELEDFEWDETTITVDNRSFTFRKLTGGDMPPKLISLVPNFRDKINIESRYRYLDKFKTYPYTAIELTTYTGTPITLKPECVTDTNLNIVQLSHFSVPSPRVMFHPYRYNSEPYTTLDFNTGYRSNGHDFGDFMDLMTGFFNFPTFSVVNDSGLLYMAGNANSIAYQRSAADWAQQRALTANQLGYDQTSSQLSLQSALTSLGIDAATSQTMLANQTAMLHGLTNGGLSVIGGAANRNPVGGILSGVGDVANAAISMNQNTQQTAISNQLSRQQMLAQTSQGAFVRDTNKDYGDYAARGDYAMAIGAINAKVQDAQLIPPTTSGQVGGEAFNLVAWRWAVHAKIKRIAPYAMRMIGDYWLRYGYAVNRFTVPPKNMKCMSKFTYWKLRESYISTGNVPETYRQSIRGIFEKGVTVWSNPDDMKLDFGDLDNSPLNGIKL